MLRLFVFLLAVIALMVGPAQATDGDGTELLQQMIDALERQRQELKEAQKKAEQRTTQSSQDSVQQSEPVQHLGLWAAMAAKDATLQPAWAEKINSAIDQAKDKCFETPSENNLSCSKLMKIVKITNNTDVFVTACCKKPFSNCGIAAGSVETSIKRLRHMFEYNGYSQCRVRNALYAHSGHMAQIDDALVAILDDVPPRSAEIQHQIDLRSQVNSNPGGGNGLAFSTDGSKLFFNGSIRGLEYDENIIEYSVNEQRGRQIFEIPFARATDIQPELGLVGVSTGDEIKVHLITTGQELSVIKDVGDTSALALSPTGTMISGGEPFESSFSIWHTTDEKLIRSTKIFPAKLYNLSFSANGDLVMAFATQDLRDVSATAFVWNTETGKLVSKINSDKLLGAAVMSNDGKFIVAVAKHDPEIYVWDVQTGQLLKHIAPPELNWWVLGFDSLALSPDGMRIAAVDYGQDAIYFIDLPTGTLVGKIESSRFYMQDAKTLGISRVTFSPGGDAIAVLNDGERALEIFDLSEMEPVTPLTP